MSIRSAMYLGQARAIEDAVEAWKADHADAMRVRELEEVVGEAAHIARQLLASQEALWANLFDAQLRAPLAIGRAGTEVYRRVRQAFDQLGAAVSKAVADGYAVEGAEAFAQANRRFEAMRLDFEKRWPSFDVAELALGIEQAKRGEAVDAKEVLRELLGSDRP